MMECPKCHKENAADARYCKMCGTSIGACAEGATNALVEAEAVTIERASMPSADASVIGTIASSYPRSESAADFARYQRKLADKAEQVKIAREMAASAAFDHETYARRRRNCLIAGVIFVVLFVMMFPSWGVSQTTGAEIDQASTAALFVLGAFNSFFFPFGFTPIKNFFLNNGFFFIAGWLFLMLAALILVMLALFFGVPYALWLQWKVSRSRKDLNEAVDLAKRIELEYQAM